MSFLIDNPDRMALHQDEFCVVLVGDFSPLSIHPLWLQYVNIVSPEEANESSIEVHSRQITLFKLAKFNFRITTSRLQISTHDADAALRMPFIVTGIVRALPQQIIRYVGLNRDPVFTGSESDWHSIGNALVPKGLWAGLIRDPGMMSVELVGKDPVNAAPDLRIVVSPFRDEDVEHGIVFHINRHFVVSDSQDVASGHASSVARSTKKGANKHAASPEPDSTLGVGEIMADWLSFLEFAATIPSTVINRVWQQS
jgi:hypothetical protein